MKSLSKLFLVILFVFYFASTASSSSYAEELAIQDKSSASISGNFILPSLFSMKKIANFFNSIVISIKYRLNLAGQVADIIVNHPKELINEVYKDVLSNLSFNKPSIKENTPRPDIQTTPTAQSNESVISPGPASYTIPSPPKPEWNTIPTPFANQTCDVLCNSKGTDWSCSNTCQVCEYNTDCLERGMTFFYDNFMGKESYDCAYTIPEKAETVRCCCAYSPPAPIPSPTLELSPTVIPPKGFFAAMTENVMSIFGLAPFPTLIPIPVSVDQTPAFQLNNTDTSESITYQNYQSSGYKSLSNPSSSVPPTSTSIPPKSFLTMIAENVKTIFGFAPAAAPSPTPIPTIQTPTSQLNNTGTNHVSSPTQNYQSAVSESQSAPSPTPLSILRQENTQSAPVINFPTEIIPSPTPIFIQRTDTLPNPTINPTTTTTPTQTPVPTLALGRITGQVTDAENTLCSKSILPPNLQIIYAVDNLTKIVQLECVKEIKSTFGTLSEQKTFIKFTTEFFKTPNVITLLLTPPSGYSCTRWQFVYPNHEYEEIGGIGFTNGSCKTVVRVPSYIDQNPLNLNQGASAVFQIAPVTPTVEISPAPLVTISTTIVFTPTPMRISIPTPSAVPQQTQVPADIHKKPSSQPNVITAPSKTPASCNTIPADANCDGKVDGVDYLVVLGNMNRKVSGSTRDGDFNGDGIVNNMDLSIWTERYSFN